MRLRTKFNLVLVIACLIGMTTASYFAYVAARKNAIVEIENEIAIIRGNALAVRAYTSTGVAPLLAADNDILFLPHRVPSFSAQTVFAQFQGSFRDYYYKEAALNPTNPDDLAEPWEAELINQLRDNPDLASVSVEREVDGIGPVRVVAFPLKVGAESCLECHSDPALAPAAMVDLYGTENGFGWQLGETIGAQVIYAPLTLADTRAKQLIIVLVATVLGAFSIVIIVINVLLSRIVIRPVTTMSKMAEQVSLGDFSAPDYVKPGKDEISSLSVSFNRMRRSLDSAMKLLDD